jgi:hypothetical protein
LLCKGGEEEEGEEGGGDVFVHIYLRGCVGLFKLELL